VAKFSASDLKIIASLLRLLGSNREGERLGSVSALDRKLKAASADFHVLADLVELGDDGELSEAEMKKLYDAGYAAGVRAAEANVAHDDDGFRDINGRASWHAMAMFCQDRSKRLRTPKERDFVEDMAGFTVWREPTPKQAKWLQSIYARLGGR